MAMRPECINAVAQALGKDTLSQLEQRNIEDRIINAMRQLAKKDREAFQKMNPFEKLNAAGELAAQDILSEKLRKNKILAQDIIRQTNNTNQLSDPKRPAHQNLDRMIAAYGDMTGVDSLNSGFKAIRDEYKKGLWDFYTQIKGWLRIRTDKQLMQNIVKERFGENTGDAMAQKIAKQLEKVYEGLRTRFNELGGNINDLGNRFGFNTVWSRDKLRSVGRFKWNELAYKNIDRNTLIDAEGNLLDDAATAKLIDDAYETIIMDGLNKTNEGELAIKNTGKVTNRFSDSRVLHWKDANAWLEMQEAFGELPFVELVDYHIDAMAKSIALVEKFGSNPNRAFDLLVQEAKRIDLDNGLSEDSINSGVGRAKVMYDAFVWREMGEGSETWNMIGMILRAWNVPTLLGSTLLSATNDLATVTKLARFHGIPAMKAYGYILRELNPFNPADKEHSFSMGIALDAITNSLGRFAMDDLTSQHSKASKMLGIANTAGATVLRASLLTAWTRAMQAGWSKMLMNKYATLTKSKEWGQLGKEDQEFLGRMGFDENTWQVLRLSNPIKDSAGNPLITIDSIRAIPDDQLKHLGNPREVKNQVVKRYWAHVLDEQGMAVIEADLRERTKLFGKTHGGSLLGFMGKGAMQFKSFPTAFLMRHGSRALRDGVLSSSPYTYMIPLVTGMTILGGLSSQLQEISRGNNPMPMWDDDDPMVALKFFANAVAKGGGLPILGDIMMSGSDPMGRDMRDFLLGPLGGDLVDLVDLTAGTGYKILNGKDVTNKSNQIFMLAKNKTPGQNIWWLRAPLNRLVFDDFQNMVAPDYQQKYKRKMQKIGRSQWWESGEGLDGLNPIDFSEVVN